MSSFSPVVSGGAYGRARAVKHVNRLTPVGHAWIKRTARRPERAMVILLLGA